MADSRPSDATLFTLAVSLTVALLAGILAFTLGQGFAAPAVNAGQTLTETLSALVVVFALLPRAAPAPSPAGVRQTVAPLPAPLLA